MCFTALDPQVTQTLPYEQTIDSSFFKCVCICTGVHLHVCMLLEDQE